MGLRNWSAASFVIAVFFVVGSLANEQGLGRFHLGHQHARERTHAHADASHVQWTSVLTADQHARALGYMVRYTQIDYLRNDHVCDCDDCDCADSVCDIVRSV